MIRGARTLIALLAWMRQMWRVAESAGFHRWRECYSNYGWVRWRCCVPLPEQASWRCSTLFIVNWIDWLCYKGFELYRKFVMLRPCRTAVTYGACVFLTRILERISMEELHDEKN